MQINFCIFLFCVILIPQGVFAEKIGISVDQTSIAFDANIDEAQEFVIKVTNSSEKVQEINIGVMDYVIKDDNELEFKQEFDENTGLRNWISSEKENITLEPNQAEEITFVFVAPDSAPVGSHHGVVYFRSNLDNRGDITVQGQIAVHILVNVKGETYASGRVNSFDIPFFVVKNIDYVTEFENMGNIHYVPYGEVVVRNIFTKKEETYKYDKHFVFPGKKFTFAIMGKKIPSIFSLFRVQVNFVDGEGVVRSRNDYMMGYLFPIVICVVIAVLFLIIRWSLKKRGDIKYKRMDNQQKKRVQNSLQKISDEQKKREAKKKKEIKNNFG